VVFSFDSGFSETLEEIYDIQCCLYYDIYPSVTKDYNLLTIKATYLYLAAAPNLGIHELYIVMPFEFDTSDISYHLFYSVFSHSLRRKRLRYGWNCSKIHKITS
jgi:hypothetical protein